MLAVGNSAAPTAQNASANRYARFINGIRAPQPSFSYAAQAPSGPYASPRGPQMPYGYDPIQSGQSLQAPSNAGIFPTPHGPMTYAGGQFVPLKRPGTQPINEYYAQMGNLIRGGRPADPTTMGHADSAAFAAKLIASLAPFGAIDSLGVRGAAKGIEYAPSAVDRIIGGSSAPTNNPNLLSRLGAHADEVGLAGRIGPKPTPPANPSELLARIMQQTPDYGTVAYNMRRRGGV